MTTTSTNRIDWKNGNVLGATKVVADAKNEPAMPASTADMVNASVRTASGLTRHRAGGDLRIAHRAHRQAPSALREPLVQREHDAP